MAGRLTSDPAAHVGVAPSPAAWRAAMGYFASGVTIVTTWDGEAPVGSTVNAFCSVSLDPPLLLVCIDLANPIRGPLETAGVFGVNMLHEEGLDFARRFSNEPQGDRFQGLAYSAAPGGAPQLAAAPVFIDCILENLHGAGDHLIAIGRGRSIEQGAAAAPLLYHRGGYPKLAPPA
ncbi:MAG TPA: flavin reductase family protein [Caulobacteraceae bacterium]|nr:flavin reductase family protein [Caulobacteraceae bacterium]